MQIEGKTALVTGAASGIGRATAVALARAGADPVVICDLDEAGLADTAREIGALGRLAMSRRADVANRADMRALADLVHAERPAVDILVNNAGVGLGARFLETTLEDWDWILSVNLMGVVHGCHFFVPKMVERGAGGHVVNVASTAGFFALAELSAYSTTKYGVLGFSEALRDELASARIPVTAICPGLIRTRIAENGRFRGDAAEKERKNRLVENFKKRAHPPERVARAIVRAVRGGHDVVPVAPEAWVTYYAKRLMPRITMRLGRWIADATMFTD